LTKPVTIVVIQVKAFIDEFNIPGIRFIPERISEGQKACCFTWRVEIAGVEKTTKGVSFYELADGRGDGRISYIRDIAEPVSDVHAVAGCWTRDDGKISTLMNETTLRILTIIEVNSFRFLVVTPTSISRCLSVLTHAQLPHAKFNSTIYILYSLDIAGNQTRSSAEPRCHHQPWPSQVQAYR
jgi:hypothetical protein